MKAIAKAERLKSLKAKRHSLRVEKRKKQAAIAWSPLSTNKPQTEAFASPADRLFYGGAAGGGKTDLILGLSLTQLSKSIIFRRTYPELKGLIERSREIVGSLGDYNKNEKIWQLPKGRTLEFGAVQYESDKEKFQGRDHSGKLFDEITRFTRTQFEYLSAWNRSAKGDRCRIVATGNPPTTPEGLWVIEYWGPWLDPTNELFGSVRPGELVWFVTYQNKDIPLQIGGDRPNNYTYITEQGEEIELEPHSRTFIPAKLSDNEYLAKTNYLSVLQSLPDALKDALIHGKFSLEFEDDEWQVIPSTWVDAAFARWDAIANPPTKLTAVGCDIARGGADETVICPRYGWYFGEIRAFPGTTTPDGQLAATQIVKITTGHPDCRIVIDVVGVGGSVVDTMKANPEVVAFSGSKRATGLDETKTLAFKNLRSEMIWRMREALDPENGVGLALPRSAKLKADLCSARWESQAPTKHQMKLGALYQVVVESKDDIKERIGRSPDYGDAVCMAMYEPKKESITINRGKMKRR